MAKQPLYPHVPKGRGGNGRNGGDLNRMVSEITDKIRQQGRLHGIDVAKAAFAANLSPNDVIERLPKDITLDASTGWLTTSITPVYYGALGLNLWTEVAGALGVSSANALTAKMDELKEAAKSCRLTGVNGVFDQYDDLRNVIEEFEEEHANYDMMPKLTDLAAREVAKVLKADCQCRIQ